MKTIITICSILILIDAGCSPKKTNPIEGVWKVVGWDRYDGDSLIWSMPGNMQGDEILMFAKEHHLWAGRYKLDTTYWNNFGGSTYTLNGNHLEATILYYGNPDRAGEKLRLLWEYRNDTAYQTWPMDETWNLKDGPYNIQKWVRIE
jgi:hypothetical protein